MFLATLHAELNEYIKTFQMLLAMLNKMNI